MNTKKDLLSTLDFDYLIQFNLHTKLLKSKRYYTKKDYVNALTRQLSYEGCLFLYENYKKGVDGVSVGKTFFETFNPNAGYLTGLFARELAIKKIKSYYKEVLFFEFPVGSRRVDIAHINNRSFAYELKSSRDNYNRLVPQLRQFSKVFDYLYLMTGQEDIPDISESFGVIFIQINKSESGTIEFKLQKKAKLNDNIDCDVQLSLLNHGELFLICSREGFIKRDKFSNIQMRNLILRHFENNEINSIFKKTLKERYSASWLEFIKQTPTSETEEIQNTLLNYIK